MSSPCNHHRRSIRLPQFDYSSEGAYFVTICAYNRECLFGEISNGQMGLNDYGKIVADTWRWLNRHYTYVQLDECGVMPNHFHGIIMINHAGGTGAGNCKSGLQTNNGGADCRGGSQTNNGGADCRGGSQTNNGGADCRGGSRTAPTDQKIKPLGRLVGAFKTVSTKHINELRRTTGAILWQRNYYEHIIRDDDDLNRIREYIINNPAKWTEDEDNPLNIKKGTKTQS